MQHRGPIGIAALVNPENPYQSTVSLWAVGTFFGLLVLSCWIYLHWVWAREQNLGDDGPPLGAPRVVLTSGQGWTTDGATADDGQMSIVDLLPGDPQGLSEGLRHGLLEAALLRDLPADLGGGILPQVSDALASLLGAPLGPLVLAALHRHPDVQALCMATIGRRGAAQQVVVRDHVLEAVSRATVGLDVDGARTPVLDVVLTLSLTVDSLAVDVAHGQVVATGPAQASSGIDLSAARPGGPPQSVLSRQNPSQVLPPFSRTDLGAESPGSGRSGSSAVGIPGARAHRGS